MKLIITPIFCLILSQATAQSIEALNLQTTGHFIDNTLRIVTSPQVDFKNKKHTWSVGPAILVATEIATSDKNLPKLVGLQATYKSYPLSAVKEINFHFFDDLLLQRIVNTWTSNVWVKNQEAYEGFEYKSVEYIVQNHLGYGLDLVLGRRLLIQQSVGLGIYYSHTDGDEITPGAPEINNEDQNINGYADFGFSWQIKMGLGIRL